MDEKHVNGAPDSAELVKPVVSAALEQQQETSLEITSLNIDTQSSESAEAETQAVNEKTKADAETLRKDKKKTKNRLIRFLVKWSIIGIVIALVFTFVLGMYPVHGNYMYPMLKDGDLIITLKIDGYDHGDAVTLKNGDTRNYSRVIGVEGDHIEIKEGVFNINGFMPSEEIFYNTLPADTEGTDIIVGSGEVFVMNDFREDMNDSRTIGTIAKTDLDGKVMFIFRWRGF